MKYIILVLSIVVISSCTSRENYDPLITDMEACQELIKVKNCLDKFDFDVWGYTLNILEHLYPKYTLENIKDALNCYNTYGERYGDPSIYTWIKDQSRTDWSTGRPISIHYDTTYHIDYRLKEKMKIPKAEVEDMIKIWDAVYDLSENLEKYLYTQCKSKVILKEEVKFPEYLFIDDVLKQLMSIFNSCNMPAIDYSELLNDDEKHYQVWAISKESDIHRKNDTKITVFFNDKNKRTYMRLFHSR